MLRSQRRTADEHGGARRQRRTADSILVMPAEPLEVIFNQPIELRHPDAPNTIVRLGSTLTQVMGFGPSRDVAAWIARAMPTPSIVVSSEAIDEARHAFADAVLSHVSSLEADLDRLELRAGVIESELSRLDDEEVAAEPTQQPVVAAEALALALEWDALAQRERAIQPTAPCIQPVSGKIVAVAPLPVAPRPSWQGSDAVGPTGDEVMAAHICVDRARNALNDAKRSDRKELLRILQQAEDAERKTLRLVGAANYSEYLMSLQAQAGSVGALRSTLSVAPSSDGWEPAAPVAALIDAPSTNGSPLVDNAESHPAENGSHRVLEHQAIDDDEIVLRARTAQMLGRLPGPNPATELRSIATQAPAPRPAPFDRSTRDALIRELDAIDERGQALADELSRPVEMREPSDRELVDLAIPGGATTLVIDGDLLFAAHPDVRDLLMDRIRDSIFERRVVLVSDDTMLDAWVDTIPQGMLWSSGHLHLVQNDGVVWADDPNVRGAAILSSRSGSDPLAVCINHPGQSTRLSCPRCGLPYCSVCLITIDRRATVECVGCALGRSGVRSRRWRT